MVAYHTGVARFAYPPKLSFTTRRSAVKIATLDSSKNMNCLLSQSKRVSTISKHTLAQHHPTYDRTTTKITTHTYTCHNTIVTKSIPSLSRTPPMCNTRSSANDAAHDRTKRCAREGISIAKDGYNAVAMHIQAETNRTYHPSRPSSTCSLPLLRRDSSKLSLLDKACHLLEPASSLCCATRTVSSWSTVPRPDRRIVIGRVRLPSPSFVPVVLLISSTLVV